MSDQDGIRFLEAFDQRCDVYLNQFEESRQQISEDGIHDLRVAARRLLAMLAILTSIDANAPTRKLRRFVKDQLDALDDLRDAQVMLLETPHLLEQIPSLAPIQIYEFQMYLEKREKEFIQAADKHLNRSKPADLQNRIQPLHTVAQAHVRDELLPDKLLSAVDAAHARVVQALANVDAGEPNTIHRVRIAFKSFRYMIETVNPFLGHYPENLLKCMHDYQDAMGNLHDVTVFLERMKEFEAGLRKHPEDHQDFAARKIEGFYSRRLDRLVRQYLKRKDEFYQFWRPAPDQPFPWERSNEPLHHTPRNRRATPTERQRAGRQPASSDRRGPQEDAQDRQGAGGDGSAD